MNEERPTNKIPEFTSLEEEASWFDAHDIGDYLEEFTVIKRDDIVVRLGEENTSTSGEDWEGKIRL